MMNAKSAQVRPETLVVAALAKWHRCFASSSCIAWKTSLNTDFSEATEELTAVMQSKLGTTAVEPYKAFCNHLYEMHESGNEFPTEAQARRFKQLYDVCRISTAAYGIVTRQERSLERLILIVAQNSGLADAMQLKKLDGVDNAEIVVGETIANQKLPRKGIRKPELRKRQLIAEALDNGIDDYKQIQGYVATILGTGQEKVSRKMISEVKKSRQANKD